MCFSHIVEHLADVLTEVAVILEVLRKGDERRSSRCDISESLAKIVDFYGGRAQTGEE